MSTSVLLKQGNHVRIPWGIDQTRDGVIVEVWRDRSGSPTHVRVALSPVEEGEESSVLLLNPDLIVAAA